MVNESAWMSEKRRGRVGKHLRAIAMLSAAAPTIATAGMAQHLWSASRRPHAVVAGTRPNIIVILADDLGYADVSAYKIDRFHTPNIDRIGMQGVRFTDAYATAPVCGPSRAGLLSGRNQQRFGLEYNVTYTVCRTPFTLDLKVSAVIGASGPDSSAIPPIRLQLSERSMRARGMSSWPFSDIIGCSY
jgi:Sulfatase